MKKNLQQIVNRLIENSRQQTSFVSATLTGLFAGAMMTVMTITYSSLIFSGDLSRFIGQGIALGLSSVIIIGFILTVLSRSSHLLIQLDDDTAPVFALLLTLLAASMPISTPDPALLVNILAALFFATIISGITLTLFGVFNFGNFVQFLPYSVMGGYFAAVGWLLLIGTLLMLTGIQVDSVADFRLLFSSEMVMRWLPAVLIGFWLRLLTTRFDAGTVIACTLTVCTLIFFGSYALQGISPAQLMQNNHLIGPFGDVDRNLFAPISQLDWRLFDIDTTLGHSGNMASITLISLLSIILCISGLSLTLRKDLDINHELKVTGLANLSSGLLGGMAALPSLSISKLAHDIHPDTSRMIGFSSIAFAVVIFYFGMDIIAFTPKVLLGGISIYIGLGFVKDWLIDGYKKFGGLEYSVIPIILVVSIFAGFLEGVITGIFAAIVLFVVKYSRIRILRYSASGKEMHSNLVRDEEETRILNQHGHLIQVFTLQGYLFFGTAGSLYNIVLDAINQKDKPQIQYILLDFSQVIGVDSSATLNFEKLAQRLVERKIHLITTNLKPDLLEMLRRGGMDLTGNAFLIQHVDLDQGLEWCEKDILSRYQQTSSDNHNIFDKLGNAGLNHEELAAVKSYFTKSSVKSGDVLASIGEDSDFVLFPETCSASVYIVDSNGTERRVSGAGCGSIFGEIGFILGIPRTAMVKADNDGDIYILNRKCLNQMEDEHPQLASAIIRYISQTLADRLVRTTQSLQAIL